jgi:hypothetical protein
MWTTFVGKHIKPSLAEIVLALIPNRICNYRFCNRHDSLSLCSSRTFTCNLLQWNRCSWFTQLYVLCQLFVFVIRIRYLLCIYLSVIIRSFILFVVRLFICFIFIWVLLIVVQKKNNNSDPELCSGILIP